MILSCTCRFRVYRDEPTLHMGKWLGNPVTQWSYWCCHQTWKNMSAPWSPVRCHRHPTSLWWKVDGWNLGGFLMGCRDTIYTLYSGYSLGISSGLGSFLMSWLKKSQPGKVTWIEPKVMEVDGSNDFPDSKKEGIISRCSNLKYRVNLMGFFWVSKTWVEGFKNLGELRVSNFDYTHYQYW